METSPKRNLSFTFFNFAVFFWRAAFLRRIRMKCGTRITPCGGTPLGAAAQKKNTRLKGTTSPAGTARRAMSDGPGGCAFQARAMCRTFPKRALRVAHGVMFVPPRWGVSVTNPQSPKRKLSFTFLNFAVSFAFFAFEKNVLCRISGSAGTIREIVASVRFFIRGSARERVDSPAP